MAQSIAHRHRDVALPALMANAADGAAFGVAQKFSFAPAKQRDELLAGQAAALVKIRQSAALGELVPGTDELAIVAAVDAVADQGAQLHRNWPAVLDGEIGDTAPGVQLIGRNDGLGGANIDAAGATAAVRRAGLRGGQRKIHEDFTQEEHAARFSREDQGVFAAPADAAARRQLCLQNGRGIREHAMAKRADLLGDPISQFLQTASQHLVIIPPARIDRDNRLCGALQARKLLGLPGFRVHRPNGSGLRQIIQPRGDHTHRAGHELGGAGALHAMRSHIVHLPMKTGVQPSLQRRLRIA